MTAFLITYATRSGRKKEITLNADSPAQVRKTLRQRGILPISLLQKEALAPMAKPAKRSRLFHLESLRELLEGGITIRDKALFANKLSTLVDAGVPILRGLDLMRTQQRSTLFRKALAAMTQDINQGDSLGNAMRRWPKVFDRLSIALVEAGEAGGVLDDTLRRLAKLLEENARLQNQIRSALGYPITVLVVAIAVFLAMTIFLIPTFATIFEDLNAELPWFTQMMIELSKLLRSFFLIILIGVLLLSVFLFKRYYSTPAGRRQVDRLVLRLPLFGDLLQKTASAQFSRTLGSLSRAGVPILMALEIARETIRNSVVSDAIQGSRNEVTEGIPLSMALSTKGVFPDMMVSMLAIGEETGEMDAMLSKVADFYEDEVTNSVKLLTSMIEPFMIIIVGIIVGSILLAMYLPMFSVFQHVG
jgi:type IV pilus assembly protein PilC